jgi:hypothetical protein
MEQEIGFKAIPITDIRTKYLDVSHRDVYGFLLLKIMLSKRHLQASLVFGKLIKKNRTKYLFQKSLLS